MNIQLAPVTTEPELTDPAQVGEWAEALQELANSGLGQPWGLHLASVDGEPVGVGLFKGPPDQDGWAEIAYLTFLPQRGRGIASQIAGELVRIASSEGVVGVRAHTLPEANASTAVLDRNGFHCLGTVDDPDDGEVWRWELRVGRDDGGSR